eukprot:COSAG06_NODE_48588_length_331_cov_0.659483_1_plen_29_part_10
MRWCRLSRAVVSSLGLRVTECDLQWTLWV